MDNSTGIQKDYVLLRFEKGNVFWTTASGCTDEEYRAKGYTVLHRSNDVKEMVQHWRIHSSVTPYPFSGDMWAFLLNNALRCLTEEQRAGLCFDLYSRSSLKDEIDTKISQHKSANESTNAY